MTAPVLLARNAMNTRFEIVLHGDNPIALRAAGEEALEEIERLDARLSLFRPDSEIGQVNARAAREAVRVTPEVFALLRRARQLHADSGGAFDITLAPLLRCWGLVQGTGQVPSPDELTEARAKVGMHWVELNEADFTVRFAREGVMLDLGAIGKGYAVDRAAEILREAGVTSALIHGGTSTAYAIGQPPDAGAWKIAIDPPGRAPEAPPAPLAIVPLRDDSLSVSAVWGKSFTAGGRTYGHVIHPRTGEPAATAVLAAVALPSATESDALSTALLVLGRDGHERITGLRPGMRTLLVSQARAEQGFEFQASGIRLERTGRA